MSNPVKPSRPSRRQALATVGLSAAAAAFASATASAAERTPTAQEKANMKVIDDFLVAFNKRDVAAVLAFFPETSKFAASRPGKFQQIGHPKAGFTNFINGTASISMKVKPGTTRAVGPMVTHERVDTMVMKDGSHTGSGTWFGVFSVVDGKIQEFIDFQID